MTNLAKRITETPMAPYATLLRRMSREEKQIVVTFITESMDEPQGKDNAEIIREKYKNLHVSPEIKRMRGCIKLTDEDMKDERIQSY